MDQYSDDEVDSLADEIERVEAIEAIDALEDSINSGGIIAWLLLDAKKASDTAREALVTVDPTDSRAIMRLQFEVGRFNALMHWVGVVRDNAMNAAADISESDLDWLRREIRGENEAKDA